MPVPSDRLLQKKYFADIGGAFDSLVIPKMRFQPSFLTTRHKNGPIVKGKALTLLQNDSSFRAIIGHTNTYSHWARR